MTTKPYHWIASATEALVQMGALPLWGSPPPFPWEIAARSIQQQLSLKSLSLRCKKMEILPSEKLLDGLGEDPITLSLQLSPLPETLFWVMPQQQVRSFTTQALTSFTSQTEISDLRFIEGYYRFLILNLLSSLTDAKPFGDLTPVMAKAAPLPSKEAVCIDIEIEANGHSLWGRIIAPVSFQKEFKSHFATKRTDLLSMRPLPDATVHLHLEIGSCSLSQKAWDNLHVGDLVLLDSCSLDPKSKNGTTEITLGSIPLFQASISQKKIKILDYSFYSEVPMSTEQPTPKKEKQKPSPENLESAEQENLSEELAEEEHLWSSEEESGSLEQLVPIQEVPLTLIAEIGKLEISLEKLLELEPGTTLELKTKPEDAISITLSGKRVAKAELIQLGEALGLKILELGK